MKITNGTNTPHTLYVEMFCTTRVSRAIEKILARYLNLKKYSQEVTVSKG